jgi:2-dehydro-3-deoxy-D-arabinonate dehydratase
MVPADHAQPVAAVKNDHHSTTRIRTFFGPNRSPSQPPGIWNGAYASVNARLDIVGYCAGNDVSSRDIEGENPLYLPQAKVYDGSCALGPGILLCDADELRDLPIRISVSRAGDEVFQGETRTAQMARPFEELVAFLGRELATPHGAFLMTGTGIVPPPDFSMQKGDRVRVTVGQLMLENLVSADPRSQEA